ncbi:MAG: murein biosynthesis integral membrane protein MurJ [Burkholderiaceae bacterium]|nr:murein biosynthesis integral membrane protein MurJ [Microbacteriaceae bacterium]
MPPRSPGLGRASAILASGTLVSRLLGFVKAIVLAGTIGVIGSAAGDAFAIGNQLPNNIYVLIAGGILGAILVPQIVRAGLHADGGAAFINKIVTLGASVFVVIAILATLAAPLLVRLYAQSGGEAGGGFTPAGIALATAFAYWCLPQVLFYALYSLLGEVLNARKVFGPFTWAPAVNNVVAIVGLLVFAYLFGGAADNNSVAVWDLGRITLLGASTTLGVAAQTLVLVLFWKRAGLKFRPDFRWRGVGLRRTGKSAGWVFGMFLATQVAGVFQVNVASTATGAAASVSALNNAWLIFMLPHSVIAVSIATAYFTRMSSHASSGNLAGVREDVGSSLRVIGLFITFASAALIVVAFPFARVFAVTGFADVSAMAFVIMAFVVGLVPFSAVFVMQRAFYALDDTRTPFLIEVTRSTLFIAGALSCTLLPVEWVAAGLALVTATVGTVQATITFVLLRRRLGSFGGRALLRRHVQYLFAALAAAIVGGGILVLLGGLTSDGFAQATLASAMVTIAVIGAGMASVYLGVLFLMKNADAASALSTATARLRR